MPTHPSQESNLGLPADVAGTQPTELLGPGRKATRISDVSTILLLAMVLKGSGKGLNRALICGGPDGAGG